MPGWFIATKAWKDWDSERGGEVLAALLGSKETKRLVMEAIKAGPGKVLHDNDTVFLWKNIPGIRKYLNVDQLSSRARAYLITHNKEFFKNSYEPNKTTPIDNKGVLEDIHKKEMFDIFLDMIDDNNLAILLHRYPLVISNKLASFRVKRSSLIARRFIRLLDCSKVRNQSHLRALIVRFPWIMQKQTLSMMDESPIDPPTWARIITSIRPPERIYFPVDTGPWLWKGIFKTKLKKGRNMKAFKDFEIGLRTSSVDNSSNKSVELEHDNDISKFDAVDST